MKQLLTELICAAFTYIMYRLTPIGSITEAAGYTVMYYIVARVAAWWIKEEKEDTDNEEI